MSRFALFGAVALTVGMFARGAYCGPTPDLPAPPVDLFAAANAAAQAQPGGASPAVAPLLAGAAAITSGAMQAATGAKTGADAATGASTSLGGAAPMSSSDLGASTGGSNSYLIGAVTEQALQASNTGNQMTVAGGLTNGPVTVQSNAFSGFSGIGNFVMNTGNQNNVQGSLNVTIITMPMASQAATSR